VKSKTPGKKAAKSQSSRKSSKKDRH
jgi:hypothetical protein